MAHVFISYKHEDGDFAELLRGELKKGGFEVWMDTDIQGGDKWSAAIDLAIRNSLAVIVVMSSEARKSEYVTYEWSFALGMQKTVIPILLRETELHPKLAEYQHMDFTRRTARPWNDLITHLKGIEQAQDSLGEDASGSAFSELITARDQAVIPQYIAAILDPDISVRLSAISMLARIGDKQSIEGIADALKDPERRVRIAAADALGKFHSTIAVSALLRALQDKTGYVRAHAAKSLGLIGDARAIPALTKRLDDNAKTVRRFAGDALEEIGTPKALAAIEEWRRKQQDQQ